MADTIPQEWQGELPGSISTMKKNIKSGTTDELKTLMGAAALGPISPIIAPFLNPVIGSGLGGAVLTNAIMPTESKGSVMNTLAKIFSKAEHASNKAKFFKNTDKALLNADGTPKTFYIGKPKGNMEKFGKKSYHDNNAERPVYQKRGDVFATENADFADQFSRAPETIENIGKIKKILGDSVHGYSKGEGNIYPVNSNAKNIFDPDNPNHMNTLRSFLFNELKAGNQYNISKIKGANKPLIGAITKMQDKNVGWRTAEEKQTLNILEKLGYDGQLVHEEFNKSPMFFNSDSLKSIFNSGQYGKSSDYMNSIVPITGLGLSTKTISEIQNQKQ